MSDHTDAPDPTAAGFRLSLIGPRGSGKAWRAPLSPVWHVAFEPKGDAPVEKRRLRHAGHVEDWLCVRVAAAGETVELLYDGPCDPSASEDANRETFIVGAPRPLVFAAARKPDDMSPWAMAVRADAAETEGLRVAKLAQSEARQRREQDRVRRQGGR
ncbi:hypothetical protein [Aureimonas sp. N4]|uniref:hypothetical protein n=1 Tax=Aureimonas sp. N4 TaxID=1638165 RepID=UPI000780D902|nr:hypothetical protein [Aureimonas sp. N4]